MSQERWEDLICDQACKYGMPKRSWFIFVSTEFHFRWAKKNVREVTLGCTVLSTTITSSGVTDVFLAPATLFSKTDILTEKIYLFIQLFIFTVQLRVADFCLICLNSHLWILKCKFEKLFVINNSKRAFRQRVAGASSLLSNTAAREWLGLPWTCMAHRCCCHFRMFHLFNTCFCISQCHYGNNAWANYCSIYYWKQISYGKWYLSNISLKVWFRQSSNAFIACFQTCNISVQLIAEVQCMLDTKIAEPHFFFLAWLSVSIINLVQEFAKAKLSKLGKVGGQSHITS